MRAQMEKVNEEIMKIRDPSVLERIEVKTDKYPCLVLRKALAKGR